MNLKPYPKYKDSGIEWLGKVPEEWEVMKLKWVSRKITSGGTPNRGIEAFFNGNIPWITTGELKDDYIHDANEKITTEGLISSSAKIFKKGTILIALYGATVGKLGILNIDAATNQACCAITANDKIESKYLFYILLSARQYLLSEGYGGGQPNISQDIVKNIFIPILETKEQKKVVDYLDQRTAKIDDLIKKNKKLIEVLKEKRQAIISHAVTKGLDPNAKMKGSGIEWIGKIPEGWEVKRLKYVAEIVLGKMLQNEDAGNDKLKFYMRAQNIQWEVVDTNDVKEMWFSDYEMKKYRLQKGDLLVSEGGEVGRTSLWNGELEECYIQNSVHRVTVNKKLANNKYLLYLLETYGKWGYFESIVNRVSIGHLTREKLKENEIICPPKNEQERIVTYLDKKSSAIDKAIQKILSQNEKLKEYWQTLISNVVTGKVRVAG